MPFMKGRAPIRRTLDYLEKGQLILKNYIKILTINYNHGQVASKGAYDFVFWHLPQLQYKNPAVQMLTFKNTTPSPFFKFYLDNGQKILIDVDSRSKEEIHDHLKRVMCKPADVLQAEALLKEKKMNPANFGHGSSRWCICEVPGQVPCPAWVPVEKEMRGKYKFQRKDVEEDAA
ncbi:probable 28S ribosomal protein S25, mitochondrial [Gigantopelta aegis]|uniref:probable 28S ribosomal protein S25, mitochondrial n=1 Tax=Gigantopelta aegis TaxID=1735272 RepID=UPI001B887E3C|nr:probable 28S ribosomal protein S25, mitochondrial [Gigantopelta aegis]